MTGPIGQAWDWGLAAATQALYNLAALQLLGSINTPAPADVNAWLRDSARQLAQQDAGQATVRATRNSTPQSPPSSLLTPLEISKQICKFGRYPETRPRGLLCDSYDRISLNSLMDNWAAAQGLTACQIKEVLQEHATSDKRQRFTTTTTHSDTLIAVSQPSRTTTSKRRRGPKGDWQSSTKPIGAPASPSRTHR